MSHTVKIEIELTDLDVLKTACKRLNLKYNDNSTVQLYDGNSYTGFVVQLPNWNFPIVISGKTIYYDNYNGNWGNISELNKLKTYYGVEKVKQLARAKGYSYRELMINNNPQIRIAVRR